MQYTPVVEEGGGFSRWVQIVNGISWYEYCMLGARPNPLLIFWCGHPNVIFQGGALLFALLLIVSLFVGKRKGWKRGAILFVGGTPAVLVATLMVQTFTQILIF